MKITTTLHRFGAALAGLLISAPASAQTDNFNDGNDAGWTHYAPLVNFGSAASYTVTSGVYRIASDPSLNSTQLGPARAGSLRTEKKYSNFCVSVDLKDWNPAEDTSMGILARVQPDIGLGTTKGYAFTYQSKDTDVQISRVTNEAPEAVGSLADLTLAPGGNYRMIFFGVDGHLEGRIYNMSDLMTPLVVASGTDFSYAEGVCGLVVFSNDNTRASAGFDNYSATDGRIAPPEVTIGAGLLEVKWDAASSLCHQLEGSVFLDNWFPLTAMGVVSGKFVYSEPFNGGNSPSMFYRLRLGPARVGAAR